MGKTDQHCQHKSVFTSKNREINGKGKRKKTLDKRPIVVVLSITKDINYPQ